MCFPYTFTVDIYKINFSALKYSYFKAIKCGYFQSNLYRRWIPECIVNYQNKLLLLIITDVS